MRFINKENQSTHTIESIIQIPCLLMGIEQMMRAADKCSEPADKSSGAADKCSELADKSSRAVDKYSESADKSNEAANK